MTSHITSLHDDCTVRHRSLTLQAIQVIAASFLIAFCAQIRIPLYFTPVNITLQTLSILFIGAILGKKKGSLAVLAYLAQTCLGLPVLQGGLSDPLALIGPRGGYLIGFIAQAYIMGWGVEKLQRFSFGKTLSLTALACMTQLGCGVLWLAPFVGWNNVLLMGLYPFICGEMIKAFLVMTYLKKHDFSSNLTS